MLRKLIFCLSIFFTILIIAVVFYSEGLPGRSSITALGDIQTMESSNLDSIANGREQSGREFITLTYQDFDLPVYDQQNGTFLFCGQLVNDISVRRNIDCEIAQAVGDDGITIAAYDQTSYRFNRIELTTLPIISIKTNGLEEAKSISREYCDALAIVFDAKSKSAGQYDIKVKLRGSSSVYYPKPSYTMKFLDSYSGKETVTGILGMEPNTRYALNSLYEDESKIRDIVSLRIWQNILSTTGSDASKESIDMIGSEVFLNNEYMGLYGFQEVINEYSLLNGETNQTAIYKVLNYLVPSMETLDSNSDTWDGAELAYSSIDDPWAFFSELIQTIYFTDDEEFQDEIGSYLCMDNVADYYVLTSFLFATDNTWKNVVFIQTVDENGQSKLHLVPWDLDQTLGAEWMRNTDRMVVFNMERAASEFVIREPLIFGRLWAHDVNGFRSAVAARWFELRKGALSETALESLISETFQTISVSGARERDAARWPDSATCEDNSFIEEFVRQRLAYLDGFYADILAENG